MNEILLEYYRGKSKELQKCEGYLRDIIKDIRADYDARRVSLASSNHVTKNNASNKKLEDALTKFFNVKSVNIYWGNGAINAMTMKPMAVSIPDYKSAFNAGKKSNLKIHIQIYENLIYDANLNERELMAVLLHEIGHNFYYCPVQVGFNFMLLVMASPIALLFGLLQRGLYKGFAFVKDLIKKELPLVYNAYNLGIESINQVMTFFKPGLYLMTIPGTLMGYVTDPTRLIDVFTGYGDELGADSFAAMYGYGPEQASALKKMTNAENTLYGKVVADGGDAMSIYDSITGIMCDIIAGATLDPHPSNNQRASGMLKKLEADLAKGDYPPGMKKDLEEEIKRMKQAYTIVNKNSSKSNIQIRQKWYDTIDALTNGNSDFRQIFGFYFDSFRF